MPPRTLSLLILGIGAAALRPDLIREHEHVRARVHRKRHGVRRSFRGDQLQDVSDHGFTREALPADERGLHTSHFLLDDSGFHPSHAGAPSAAPSVGMSASAVTHVKEQLLQDYDPQEPPESQESRGGQVALGFIVNKLLKLDSNERTLTLAGWLHEYWYDPRLAYDSNHLGQDWDSKKNFVQMSPDSIWQPDLTVANALDYNWGELCETVDALVYDNSRSSEVNVQKNSNISQQESMVYNVMMVRPCVLKTKCDVDLVMYPFDINTCEIVFQPWGNNFLSLRVAGKQIESHISVPEYKVSFINSTSETHIYESAGGGVWPRVVVRLLIARNAHSTVVSYICPILFMVVLSWVGLWIPTGASDQIQFMATLVLTVMATNFVSADTRPDTNEDTWLDQFQSITLVSIICTTIFSILLHRLQAKDDWSDGKKKERARLVRNIQRWSRIVFPLLSIGLLSIGFFRLWRRQMYMASATQDFSGHASIGCFGFMIVVGLGLFLHALLDLEGVV